MIFGDGVGASPVLSRQGSTHCVSQLCVTKNFLEALLKIHNQSQHFENWIKRWCLRPFSCIEEPNQFKKSLPNGCSPSDSRVIVKIGALPSSKTPIHQIANEIFKNSATDPMASNGSALSPTKTGSTSPGLLSAIRRRFQSLSHNPNCLYYVPI